MLETGSAGGLEVDVLVFVIIGGQCVLWVSTKGLYIEVQN